MISLTITPTKTTTITPTPTKTTTITPTPTKTTTKTPTPTKTSTRSLVSVTPTQTQTGTPTNTPTDTGDGTITLLQNGIGSACNMCSRRGVSIAFGQLGTTLVFYPLSSPGTLPTNLFIYKNNQLIGRIVVTEGYRVTGITFRLDYGTASKTFLSTDGTPITSPAAGFRIDW